MGKKRVADRFGLINADTECKFFRLTPVKMHNQNCAENRISKRGREEKGQSEGRQVQDGHHPLGCPHLNVVASGRARN